MSNRLILQDSVETPGPENHYSIVRGDLHTYTKLEYRSYVVWKVTSYRTYSLLYMLDTYQKVKTTGGQTVGG